MQQLKKNQVKSYKTQKLRQIQQTVINRPTWQLTQEDWQLGRQLVEAGWAQPKIDLHDSKTDYIARVDMPGVEKQDLEIRFSNDGVRIRAEKRIVATETGKSFGIIERTHKGFYRMIQLPGKIDPTRAATSYHNGVLEIRMPKAGTDEQK
jgi:HSP20 family molecular chaperone IbpA